MSVPKVQNIIFDWAGVISDNIQNVYDVAMVVFDTYKAPRISLEEFREAWDQPYILFYQKYLPNLTLEEESAIFHREILRRPPANPFPGIIDSIRALHHAGKYMIVISGDIKETIFPELKKFGLERVFNEIVYDIHDKARVIESAIQRHHLNRQETIFIGDTAHEVKVGKREGILTGAVTWGYKREQELLKEKPDYVFREIDELRQLI
ncbi:MAG: HAD family hydrolase [Patescibacteria group bacterium]|nr:HAD family hydrolase [Patescibacteria group bacterium]MDD5715481.1 HAD family hydrolase [Patescibacteria group bacterium]